MKYQYDYSRLFPAVADRVTRTRKALKIQRILEDYLGRDLSGLLCLDLGCSIGVTTEHLASSARLAIGADIDGAAIRQAAGQEGAQGHYLLGDVSSMPFADHTFDVIVCSQVYEHAPSVELLVSELYRLLKNDGICYFSGPNRWAVTERHYGLPFLSWLPRRWANLYVRLAGRGREYYEHPRSARDLRRMLGKFVIHDYTLQLLADPAHFELEDELGIVRHFIVRVPAPLWRMTGCWVPNFNWVLTKHG